MILVLTNKDDIREIESDEEILACNVSDEALERAVPIIGGQATPVTMNYCACPV